MPNDSLIDTFFEECEELVEALTENLEQISVDDWDMETLNAIFRAVHSIKGSAGAFGFDELVSFTHHYETTLDKIRNETLALTEDVLRLIVRCADNMAQLVDCARDESAPKPAATEELIAELMTHSGDTPQPASTATAVPDQDFVFEPTVLGPISLDLDEPGGQDFAGELDLSGDQTFEIEFKPKSALYFSGNDPLKLIKAVAQHGDLSVDCDFSDVPTLENFDFDASYLSWTLQLDTMSDTATLEDIFEFVRGNCELSISPINSPDNGPEEDAEVAQQSDAQQEDAQEQPVAEQVTAVANDAPPVAATTDPAPKPASKKNPESGGASKQKVQATLRVDPERVDRLINSVGELIINHAVLDRHLIKSGMAAEPALSTAIDEYGNLAREIQEGVMAIRSQQVKPLFQRMGRVVREAGEATKKKVVFKTEGDSVEIDKTILERMSDPLTHMLRNAVDHGIEPPEKRAELGKAEQGTVTLSAAHRSGHVVIEISDDGAGLNRDKLIAKGVEKGIVAADANLSEAEAYALLFAPGFSTAENVTNLSGRGVGMDVVKTAITSMGGKVSIQSTEGKGSTFTISLPLTLAVLDGMIVNVGEETMVLPLANVVETIRPNPQDVREVAPNDWILCVRGEYIPVIALGRLMGVPSCADQPNRGTFVLTDTNGSTSAISVDGIQDQRQVVIKSLKGNYGEIEGVAAATILGDGNIALIIDPEALPPLAAKRKSDLGFQKQGAVAC